MKHSKAVSAGITESLGSDNAVVSNNFSKKLRNVCHIKNNVYLCIVKLRANQFDKGSALSLYSLHG